MVGLITQLVRVVGTSNVQSCAGYIADFVMLSWLEYLMQNFTWIRRWIEEISHGHRPYWFMRR